MKQSNKHQPLSYLGLSKNADRNLWSLRNGALFHLVWWSESLDVRLTNTVASPKSGHDGLVPLTLRQFILVSPCHPNGWSCFCNYDVTWEGASISRHDIEQLPCLDNRMLMISCLRMTKPLNVLSYPSYHVNKVFCYLLPHAPLYIGYKSCGKANAGISGFQSLKCPPDTFYGFCPVFFLCVFIFFTYISKIHMPLNWQKVFCQGQKPTS